MFSIVTRDDFSHAQLYSRLIKHNDAICAGAVVTFTGLVRDFNQQGKIDAIVLEHYPNMAERCLERLVECAIERFALVDAGVVHRVGRLENFEQIVWVGCAAPHRQNAFDAACYIMDTLKSTIPLWKKEVSGNSETWVEVKSTDQLALKRWSKHGQ